MMTDEEKFQSLKDFAKIIGTQTLTALLHEYHGRTEEAAKMREYNVVFEDQLRRRIELYYAMKDDE